jgi:hypothetical protein
LTPPAKSACQSVTGRRIRFIWPVGWRPDPLLWLGRRSMSWLPARERG